MSSRDAFRGIDLVQPKDPKQALALRLLSEVEGYSAELEQIDKASATREGIWGLLDTTMQAVRSAGGSENHLAALSLRVSKKRPTRSDIENCKDPEELNSRLRALWNTLNFAKRMRTPHQDPFTLAPGERTVAVTAAKSRAEITSEIGNALAPITFTTVEIIPNHKAPHSPNTIGLVRTGLVQGFESLQSNAAEAILRDIRARYPDVVISSLMPATAQSQPARLWASELPQRHADGAR